MVATGKPIPDVEVRHDGPKPGRGGHPEVSKLASGGRRECARVVGRQTIATRRQEDHRDPSAARSATTANSMSTPLTLRPIQPILCGTGFIDPVKPIPFDDSVGGSSVETFEHRAGVPVADPPTGRRGAGCTSQARRRQKMPWATLERAQWFGVVISRGVGSHRLMRAGGQPRQSQDRRADLRGLDGRRGACAGVCGSGEDDQRDFAVLRGSAPPCSAILPVPLALTPLRGVYATGSRPGARSRRVTRVQARPSPEGSSCHHDRCGADVERASSASADGAEER